MKNHTIGFKMHMLTLTFLIVLASMGARAQVCTDSLAHKWQCDTDVFGKNIQILSIPSGHGQINGSLIVVDLDKSLTMLTAPLDDKWTNGKDFYPVKGVCLGGSRDTADVEFRDRTVELRKASGKFSFLFANENPDPTKHELTILEYIVFVDGSNRTNNATCIALP